MTTPQISDNRNRLNTVGLVVIALLGLILGGASLFKNKADSTKTDVTVALPNSYNAANPQSSNTPSANTADFQVETITLSANNTVILRDQIDAMTSAKIQKELIDKSRALKATDTLYLVLETPGGSVPDGNHLITTAKALPQKVKTIVLFAASMGFHLAEALDERLTVEDGLYMQHRAHVEGVGGDLNGNFNTRVNYLMDTNQIDEIVDANRMGIDLKAYRDLTRDEYWIYAPKAIQSKVADRIVRIRCDASLDGTYDMNMQVMMFTIAVTYSKCPAITGPLDAKIAVSEEYKKLKRDLADLSKYEADEAKIKNIIEMRFFDQKEYARYLIQHQNPFKEFKDMKWTQ